jgi:glyoxylase-like metal-dependent hydrolase (beta-lactamase superfamily II)
MQHEDNIKGIAFMEAIILPMKWDEFPAEFREIFENFRTPGIGEEMIMNQNIFVEQMLPGGILRELSEDEMNQYREPYPTAESLKPVWVWPNEIPIDGEPADVHKIVTDYNQWLQETEIPKILFYVNPGAIFPAPMVEWSKANLKNLETVYVGEGIHFIQEDHPDEIGNGLADWYRGIESSDMMEDSTNEQNILYNDGAFQLVKVAEDVYSFGNQMGSFSLVLVTDEGVIVGDPVNQNHSEVMLEAIRTVTDQPIKYLIYSHSHWDHTGGGEVLKNEGATILSHIDARDWLLEHPNPSVVVADEVWEGNLKEIILGNKTLELHHFGPSHGEGMTVFYLPEEKIIYIVDIVTPKRLAFTIMPDFSPKDWERTLIEVEKLDFDTAMFGHKRAYGPASEVTEVREYLQDLRAEIFSMMQAGANPFLIPATIELPKYQEWEFYDEWLEMNTWRMMLESWMGW